MADNSQKRAKMKNTLEILRYTESLSSSYLGLLSKFDKERFLSEKTIRMFNFSIKGD